MNEKIPRVLIGCPTCVLKADSLDKYLKGLAALTYPAFDVVLEDNSPTEEYAHLLRQKAKEWEHARPGKSFRIIYSGQTSPYARARLVNGRNKIRDIALHEKYDYFLSLEQDIVPPADVIERLLRHQRLCISGAYLNQQYSTDGTRNIIVVGGVFDNEEDRKKGLVRHLGVGDLFPARVLPVAYTGLGCMLISTQALEKLPFRYENKNAACDDVYFCMDLQKEGIPTLMDTGTLAAHFYNDAFVKVKDHF